MQVAKANNDLTNPPLIWGVGGVCFWNYPIANTPEANPPAFGTPLRKEGRV